MLVTVQGPELTLYEIAPLPLPPDVTRVIGVPKVAVEFVIVSALWVALLKVKVTLEVVAAR